MTTFTTAQEKIYFQNESMSIGNEIWEFIVHDTHNRMRTILVPTISAVAFVPYKAFYWLLLSIFSILLTIAGAIITYANNYAGALFQGVLIGITSIYLAYIFFRKYIRTRNKGKIQITNKNKTTTFTYGILTFEEANKYLEPMRQCISEQKASTHPL
jgi:energy-coupling factor transporter transmembrane protein EcfT